MTFIATYKKEKTFVQYCLNIFFLANYRLSVHLLSLLVLVSVRVPLLHHGIVEVLVGKEAGTEDHGETHGQHGSHHAAVDDGVDTFPSLSLLLFPILVFILDNFSHNIEPLS